MCLTGVSGFAADDSGVRNLTGDQRMLVGQSKVIRLRRGCLKMVRGTVSDLQTDLIVKESLSDHAEIVGTGVMIVIVETIGVDKMRIAAAKLCCLFVHHIHKCIDGSGCFLCESVGTFICGSDHQTVKCFFHGNGFADTHSNVGSICRYGCDCGF